ncbi:YkgJ family cysteine cluster protein [Roseospirillum parvum]|uniref:Putative zinc-or iron-chelating domain-containing protein n=1 Tax=Roseospirillum parvum TaxID=83401 RepID=A0A1G7TXG6_9PROT|nr:YkgJ family cysteine cluster protein [Roseospirillum parvum]SDG39888.1 Putative zinc-or iron-chelating domain-containing protein [Roseospirillum parvum]
MSPEGLRPLLQRLHRLQAADTRHRLARGRDAAALARLLAAAGRRAGAGIAAAETILPPPAPVACGPACPFCCHVPVTAAVAEVIIIARHLDPTLAPEARRRLARRLANLTAAGAGLDGDARSRQRLPCPLLDGASCRVHPLRPLVCRAVASVEVAACRAAHASHMVEGVPQVRAHLLAVNAVAAGLEAGLAEAGLGGDIDLALGLAVCLLDPGAATAWLAGEPSPLADLARPPQLVAPQLDG